MLLFNSDGWLWESTSPIPPSIQNQIIDQDISRTVAKMVDHSVHTQSNVIEVDIDHLEIGKRIVHHFKKSFPLCNVVVSVDGIPIYPDPAR